MQTQPINLEDLKRRRSAMALDFFNESDVRNRAKIDAELQGIEKQLSDAERHVILSDLAEREAAKRAEEERKRQRAEDLAEAQRHFRQLAEEERACYSAVSEHLKACVEPIQRFIDLNRRRYSEGHDIVAVMQEDRTPGARLSEYRVTLNGKQQIANLLAEVLGDLVPDLDGPGRSTRAVWRMNEAALEAQRERDMAEASRSTVSPFDRE